MDERALQLGERRLTGESTHQYWAWNEYMLLLVVVDDDGQGHRLHTTTIGPAAVRTQKQN